jgi:hypothetical protein
MLPFQWKILSKPHRVLGSIWAIMAIVICLTYLPTHSNEATSQKTVQANEQTKVDKEKEAKDDTEYLNAVDKITYNTFVEAQNVRDQLKRVRSHELSLGEFADFIDTDVSLWKQYIKDIQPTSPKDSFLNVTRTKILDDLNHLSEDAIQMKNSAEANDENKLNKLAQDMLVVFNQIKQHYGEAVSQMSKYGIDPNWTPPK